MIKGKKKERIRIKKQERIIKGKKKERIRRKKQEGII